MKVALIDEIAELRETISMANGQMSYAKAKYGNIDASRLHKNKYLYFLSCGDAVKIGVSSDPLSRMHSLQTGAPGKLELLASVPLSGHRESSIHRDLAHLRLNGEWYRHTEEIDTLIKELS